MICKRCGGPTTKQDTWEGEHRYTADCLDHFAARIAAIECGVTLEELQARVTKIEQALSGTDINSSPEAKEEKKDGESKP